jgi:signal transduction histidine kinase
MAGRTGALVSWLLHAEPRERPWGWALALDAAVAVAAATGAVLEAARWTETGYTFVDGVLTGPRTFTFHGSALMLVAAALTGLPLAFRRLYPMTAALTIIAAILVIGESKTSATSGTVTIHGRLVPEVAFATGIFAAYSAVVHSRYRNLAIIGVLAGTITVTLAFPSTLPQFPRRLTALFVLVPTVVAAIGVRELRSRLRRREAEHKAATRRAVEDERARIASELHDVLTHNVSVMLVQAGAARTVLASSPEEATDALLAVEASGRTAMTELRNLLGLICPSGDELRPQPGLGELTELIGRVSDAGLPVETKITGTPWPLSPGADLAAYRVVQEALTNVLRHAGKVETVVKVEWDEQLVITVTDEGRGAVSGIPGRGLIGLRERLELYGGTLEVGPRAAGTGWGVRAVLPA